MAKKDSNISIMNKNKETIKKVSARVHEELLNTSHLFIDETVATLTRMQRITGKVIKKSEPILEKQIEITFDTVEALKNQANKGGKRALKLFGLTRQYNKLSNTIEEKIKEIPSVEEMMDDAKEIVGKAKSDVEERIEGISKRLKIDELGKVEEKATAKTKKTKAAVKRATVKAKTTAKKIKSKATTTVKSKAKTSAASKTVTKKTTPARKTQSTSATTAAKKATTGKKAKVAVSELTQIKGIGASLAAIMNDNGIKTIKDLQNAAPTALKIIAANAGNRYRSFDTNKWITAAKAIAK